MTHKHEGFWMAMDTFKDKLFLDEMVARGDRALGSLEDEGMISLKPCAQAGPALKVLCLGAHSDDIEIGCGGTILKIVREYPAVEFDWVVFGAAGIRKKEAVASAAALLKGAARGTVRV